MKAEGLIMRKATKRLSFDYGVDKMNSLGLFENKGQILVSSRVVAQDFEKQHGHIKRDVEKLGMGLSKIGDTPDAYFLESKYRNSQNLEEYTEYLLTRDGFTLLAMGFTGEKALEFKTKYIKKFNRMESLLRERQTTDWLKTRESGKVTRRETTDAIQVLIPHAENQGSKNAKMMYMTYSKLVNKTVGIESGTRDKATTMQLMQITMLEDLITRTILEEIAKGVYYKEIYKKCKSKAHQFAQLTYLDVA